MQNPNQKELADEALLLWNTISIAALQEVVSKVADTVFHFEGPKSTSAAQVLWQKRDANIRNISRYRADLAPSRASQIQEMLLRMNGEKP